MVYGIEDAREAQKFAGANSPCLRRKYGAIITDSLGNRVIATNYRLGNYCHGDFCVRDFCKVPHGEKVEVGGEIHAEQAALIAYPNPSLGSEQHKHILVAGLNHEGQPLVGLENLPCHTCAMMIKFAKFNYVWVPFDENVIPLSIDEILEHYERLD